MVQYPAELQLLYRLRRPRRRMPGVPGKKEEKGGGGEPYSEWDRAHQQWTLPFFSTHSRFFHFQYIIRKTVFFSFNRKLFFFSVQKKCSVGFTQTPTLLKLIEINAHSTSLSNTNVYIHVEKSPGLPKISGEPGQPLIDQWSCRETWWRFWWRLCLASTLCSESSIFTFNMYIYVRCLSHYRFI